MSEHSTIALERRPGAAVLTLDRPDQLNALDPPMLTELLEVLGELAKDSSLNCLVFTGRGRLFSAGVDLGTPFFMEHVDDPSIYAGKRLLDWQHELIQAVHELPFPTMAAMNGHAVGGGGLGIAMACDLRYAVTGNRMWMVPGALAVVQDFGLSWMVQRLVGPSRAMHMALTGYRVTSDEALTWGLVNEVYPDVDALDEAVTRFTDEVGSMGPDALRMLKTVLRVGERSTLREQLQVEAISNGLAFQSREFMDKKASYLGKLGGPR